MHLDLWSYMNVNLESPCGKKSLLLSFCESSGGIKKYLLIGTEAVIIGRKCGKGSWFEHRKNRK